VVLVLAAGRPAFQVFPAGTRPLVLGREGDIALEDPRLSRRHAELRREGGRWSLHDLDSRNGSFLDGLEVTSTGASNGTVVRVGDSLLLLSEDVSALQGGGVELDDGVVLGPRLRTLLGEVADAARSGRILHITGETGTGKELVARAFHRHGGGPFVAVNCAGVPAALAERLLFGARKGAYSGADADSEGFLQQAHGGTLFLDELAELSLEVQAKLLRVLETREVLALGAARAVTVDVRVCSATHGDLQARVAEGKFRQDLYFRLGVPRVALPALGERLEEVPWLVAHTLSALRPGLAAHVSLVEAALLRPWPGNLRELVVEVREAARRAGAQATRVEGQHLDAPASLRRQPASPEEQRARVEAALAASGGNVSQAARDLGLHRTQLRRVLEEHGLDPASFRKK